MNRSLNYSLQDNFTYLNNINHIETNILFQILLNIYFLVLFTLICLFAVLYCQIRKF